MANRCQGIMLLFGIAALCGALLWRPLRSDALNLDNNRAAKGGRQDVRQEPSRWVGSQEVALRPTYVRNGEGREYVWQLPSEGRPARGVLLLAPGCNHRAVDFWDPGPECPECTGLPEEKQIARAALSRGLALLAVSPGGQGPSSRCWDTQLPGRKQRNSDVGPTIEILRSWTSSQGLSGLPVFALGASSGGAFILILALQFPLAAVCAQIMAVPGHYLKSPPKDLEGNTWPYPPTLFVHMSRDGRTADRVAMNRKALQAMGVRSAEIAAQPQPLTPQFLSNRIDAMPVETSEAIFRAFREANLLDEKGVLTFNPRQGSMPGSSQLSWRTVLGRMRDLPGLSQDGLVPDLSPISEELNVLFAGHEIMADYMQQTLEWFDQSLGSHDASRGLSH